jgi:hypothetical protein
VSPPCGLSFLFYTNKTSLILAVRVSVSDFNLSTAKKENPSTLLLHYLTNRFTHFLHFLMLALFLEPKSFMLPFESTLLTFTNSHRGLGQLLP